MSIAGITPQQSSSSAAALEIWRAFCARHAVEKEAVPLFAADAAGQVETKTVGRGSSVRPLLRRSAAMESMLRAHARLLTNDWETGEARYDGLLYMMGRFEASDFVPLYIGKAETLGRGDGNLSANLHRIDTDTSKFARWGDNYAYHIGDLSACVLPGHAADKATLKYARWAAAMFEGQATTKPRLKRPVYFWSIPWDKASVGVWEELGPTGLAFLEYLLIGVASLAFPELLNTEGLSRGRGRPSILPVEPIARQE